MGSPQERDRGVVLGRGKTTLFCQEIYGGEVRLHPVVSVSLIPCQVAHYSPSRETYETKVLHRKAQYELKFREWKLRKNFTTQEWKAVSHRVGKRKKEGKESELYYEGDLIPLKKAKKGISRYSFPTLLEKHRQGTGHQLEFFLTGMLIIS